MEGNKLDSRLSNVSEKLGMVLDKALCEEDFRWELISESDKVLAKYGIYEAGDIESINKMKSELEKFIFNRMKTCIGESGKHKKPNPELTYEEAIAHNKKNI